MISSEVLKASVKSLVRIAVDEAKALIYRFFLFPDGFFAGFDGGAVRFLAFGSLFNVFGGIGRIRHFLP